MFLNNLQIPLIADLPVGKNLQDHYATNLLYTVNETIVPVVLKYAKPSSILNYVLHRKGNYVDLVLYSFFKQLFFYFYGNSN